MALALSGGVAGALAKTVVAPLERIKLLNQAGQSVGMFSTLHKVVHNEGWRALWRGNTVNMIRMIPNKGVLLSCSDLYKDTLLSLHLGHFWTGAISGAMAGGTAIALTYPLDLARTRMAGFLLAKGEKTRYPTLVATISVIWRAEGVGGLFRGVGPTLLGSFPYEGIKFGTYGAARHTPAPLHPTHLGHPCRVHACSRPAYTRLEPTSRACSRPACTRLDPTSTVCLPACLSVCVCACLLTCLHPVAASRLAQAERRRRRQQRVAKSDVGRPCGDAGARGHVPERHRQEAAADSRGGRRLQRRRRLPRQAAEAGGLAVAVRGDPRHHPPRRAEHGHPVLRVRGLQGPASEGRAPPPTVRGRVVEATLRGVRAHEPGPGPVSKDTFADSLECADRRYVLVSERREADVSFRTVCSIY